MEGQVKSVSIACFSTKSYDRDFLKKASALSEFSDVKFTFDFFEDRLSPTTAVLAKGHDAVCIYLNDEVSPEVANVLADAGVKVIALRSKSYNYVNLNAVSGRISIVHIPEYNPHAVAEFSLALLQALNRKIYKSYARSREGNFSLDGLVGGDIFGKTVGILGVGRIGKNLANIFTGFGAKILLNDSVQDEIFAKGINAEYVNLEELFKNSDYIMLNCPLTQETRHIINASSISLMKKEVVIVNTCREELLEAKPLIEALTSERIRGLAMDIFREFDQNSFRSIDERSSLDENAAKLSQLPNVVMTYHQAYLTENNLDEIMTVTLRNILKILNGVECDDEVSAVLKL